MNPRLPDYESGVLPSCTIPLRRSWVTNRTKDPRTVTGILANHRATCLLYHEVLGNLNLMPGYSSAADTARRGCRASPRCAEMRRTDA